MNFPTKYTLYYPIQKVPNSKWIVVGCTMSSDGTFVWCLDVHLDQDDPNHTFITTADLQGMTPDWIKQNTTYNFSGPRAVVNAYNAPHLRTNRLRLRRSVDAVKSAEILTPYYEARKLVNLWLEKEGTK